jgi:uncharacterized protein YbjT (DUF2867 family)
MHLVTGGSGSLGRPVMSSLMGRGVRVRSLSRKPGENQVVGDLATGEGLAAALDGVDTVVHCASDTRRFGKTDVVQARNLIDAARASGASHLVYISIVGIDRVPMPYYRRKLEVEELIASSGIAWTILRATQFHGFLIDMFFKPQRIYPFLMVPRGTVQPIAVEDVAERLAGLAVGAPNGRVDDLGGPEVLTFDEAARAYLSAAGRKPRTVHVPVVGKLARSIAEGGLTCPDHAHPGLTFREFLNR